MGLPGPLGGGSCWLHPSGGPLLIPCWGDGLSLGPRGLAALPPELAVNFAFCGIRLELALYLSPGPVTD